MELMELGAEENLKPHGKKFSVKAKMCRYCRVFVDMKLMQQQAERDQKRAMAKAQEEGRQEAVGRAMDKARKKKEAKDTGDPFQGSDDADPARLKLDAALLACKKVPGPAQMACKAKANIGLGLTPPGKAPDIPKANLPAPPGGGVPMLGDMPNLPKAQPMDIPEMKMPDLPKLPPMPNIPAIPALLMPKPLKFPAFPPVAIPPMPVPPASAHPFWHPPPIPSPDALKISMPKPKERPAEKKPDDPTESGPLSSQLGALAAAGAALGVGDGPKPSADAETAAGGGGGDGDAASDAAKDAAKDAADDAAGGAAGDSAGDSAGDGDSRAGLPPSMANRPNYANPNTGKQDPLLRDVASDGGNSGGGGGSVQRPVVAVLPSTDSAEEIATSAQPRFAEDPSSAGNQRQLRGGGRRRRSSDDGQQGVIAPATSLLQLRARARARAASLPQTNELARLATPQKFAGTNWDDSNLRTWAPTNSHPAGTDKPTEESVAGVKQLVAMYMCVNEDTPDLLDALFQAALGSPDVTTKCEPFS